VIYDLANPADREALQATLIRPTTKTQLAYALQLPDRESRIGYVRQIRSRYGEDAAQKLIQGLQESVK
jgi:hypothetical protein